MSEKFEVDEPDEVWWAQLGNLSRVNVRKVRRLQNLGKISVGEVKSWTLLVLIKE